MKITGSKNNNTVYNTNVKRKLDEMPLFRRIRTDEAIKKIKTELSLQDWSSIYNEGNNMEKAYNDFLEIFRNVYDRNCPIIKSHRKQKQQVNEWMTKGLINACKKKNTLCKQFLKNRTKESE